MVSILGNFGLSNYVGLLKYLVWFVVLLAIGLVITFFVVLLVVKKKQVRTIELDENKRVRVFSGRYKKRKGTHINQYWSRKLGKFLPEFKQRDKYSLGRQDALILYKDDNGFHHPVYVPTEKQLRKLWKALYDVDYDEALKTNTMTQDQAALLKVYALPSPHEKLDWLASKCVESDAEFKYQSWWQHPNVMLGMTIAGVFMIWLINGVFWYLSHKG